MTGDGRAAAGLSLHRQLFLLQRRVLAQARAATDMLESSLEALWHLDLDAAAEVRERDTEIDMEEVAIEAECFRLLALQRPFAHDFRFLTFCLRVNADIERVADHATSIAKVTRLVRNELGPVGKPPWPTALRELGERVPLTCHALMRAVIDEDTDAARSLVADDETIDRLDKQLYREVQHWIGEDPAAAPVALLCYRVSRELERVGDLTCNMAESVVYLATGEIIRHQKHGPDGLGSAVRARRSG